MLIDKRFFEESEAWPFAEAREILKKRLVAYEHIEFQLSILKPVVLGDNKKPYHAIFSEGEDKLLEYQKNLFSKREGLSRARPS